MNGFLGFPIFGKYFAGMTESYVSLLGLIFVVHLMAVMSPGPDFVMVVKNAVAHDRKTALLTASGIALGIGVHVAYSIWGVALLLKRNPYLFRLVKAAGALYLIYSGIKSMQAVPAMDPVSGEEAVSLPPARKAIQTGFLTNVLNPKASLFFMSLFSALIPPDAPAWFLMLTAFMLISVTFLWFAFVSLVFTHRSVRARYKRYERLLGRFFGLLLMGIGLGILWNL